MSVYENVKDSMVNRIIGWVNGDAPPEEIIPMLNEDERRIYNQLRADKKKLMAEMRGKYGEDVFDDMPFLFDYIPVDWD